MTKSKLFPTILIILLSHISWCQNDSIASNKRVKSLIEFYDGTLFQLKNISSNKLNASQISEGAPKANQVDLQAELVDLFNPSNYKCGYDAEFVAKLKKLKNPSAKEGFVPSAVSAKIKERYVYKVDGSGSCVLANSFKYVSKGVTSELVYANYSPTATNFNEASYLETNPNVYSNFVYNSDCSSYFSAALAASAGIDKNVVKSSAETSADNKNSLIIIKGVMYLPLYQAYKARGEFAEVTPMGVKIPPTLESLNFRKSVLVNIIQSIPIQDQDDNVKIILNTNYQIVLTSNTGQSKFTGSADLSASGGAGFGFGSAEGKTELKGKLSRTSSFNDYNSYILDTNVKSPPDNITIKTLKDIIAEIDKKILALGK